MNHFTRNQLQLLFRVEVYGRYLQQDIKSYIYLLYFACREPQLKIIYMFVFSFDGILHNASQETTFKQCASNLVLKALDGYNSTLFAYGETGAGKTFTMTGTNDFRHRGITPRALTLLYKEINKRNDQDIGIRISYMQIYKDKMFDLLGNMSDSSTNEQLIVTEDANGCTYVKGLTCLPANSEEEALTLLFEVKNSQFIYWQLS